MLAERLPDLRRLDGAAAEGEHRRSAGVERRDGGRSLLETELDLAARLEELGDRALHRPLELAVEIDEAPAEPLGGHEAERRLPRAHEPDQRDVPV